MFNGLAFFFHSIEQGAKQPENVKAPTQESDARHNLFESEPLFVDSIIKRPCMRYIRTSF